MSDILEEFSFERNTDVLGGYRNLESPESQ